MSYNTGVVTDALDALKIKRLPVEGIAPTGIETRIGFVVVWVNPLPEAMPHPHYPNRRVRKFALRLMCRCPNCDTVLALGRLVQHQKFCKGGNHAL